MVDTSFNSHKKNFIHKKFDTYTHFTSNTLPKFVSLTQDLPSFFHKFFRAHPDSLSLSFSLYIHLYTLFDKAFYAKRDPEAANTADYYHLKSGTIYAQWNYLS